MLYKKIQIENRIADEMNIPVIIKDSANAKNIIIIQEYSMLLIKNSCIDSKFIISDGLYQLYIL
tara:strand:- start:71 stop:262 length:192 start_codon:yes stop_codon:yes gene_type:complete